MFCCRHINNVCFVGVNLIVFTKTHSTGYINQSAVVYIIYQTNNRGAVKGSSNSSELDLNTVLNWLSSGKFHQNTDVSSKCEQFSYPWTWHTLYLKWWTHFENCSIIFNPIKCSWMIKTQLIISFYINVSYYL